METYDFSGDPAYNARVAYLPACRAVKWGAGRNQLDGHSVGGRADFFASADHRDNLGIRLRGFVSEKCGGGASSGNLPVDFRDFTIAAPLPCRSGKLALLFHKGLETGLVCLKTNVPGHVGNNVDGEPICIMELKDERSGDGVGFFILQALYFGLQQPQPVIQGFVEPFFFVLDDAGYEAAVVQQLGIRVLHRFHNR